MPYCSRCGVEVDESVGHCPLCEAPIQKLPSNDGSPWPREEAPVLAPPPLSADERKALSRTITTLGFFIPATIALAVDWFLARRVGWSLYVLASLSAVWLWAILPLLLNRRPYTLTLLATAVCAGLLATLEALTGGTDWIFSIGMPVTGMAGVLALGVVALARSTKRLGGNLAAWMLLALGTLALTTDLLVAIRTLGRLRLGWSIVMGSTVLPIVILLFYIHYRPSRRARLRRYFHV